MEEGESFFPYLVLSGTPGALTTLGSLRTLAKGVGPTGDRGNLESFFHPYLRG